MTRQASSANIDAYHGRSLGAGPPTSHLTALRDIFDEVMAYAARRASSGPPGSDAGACVDDDDSDPIG